MRRLLGLGVLVAGLALLLGGAKHPNVVHAATVNVVDSGTVVDASGNPIAGAVVALYFAPTSGTVNPADTQTTDSSGSYTVSADPTAAMLAEAQTNGGYVPFELDVSSPSLTQTTFFSRLWTGSGWTTGQAAPPPSSAKLAKGRPGVRQTPRGVWRWMVAANGGRAKLAATVDPNVCPVQTQVLASAQKLTIVGEVHTGGDASETYSYGKTADSDIQVGVSLNDAAWSVSGSVHVSSSNSSKATWDVGASVGHKVTTEMAYNHDKEFYACNGQTKDFVVRTTGWNGGKADGVDNHDLDGHCPPVNDPSQRTQPFPGKGSWETANENQVWFSTAVSVFGVGLDAKSGWGTTVVSHWDFGTNPQHYLCGSDGPVTSAHRIYAGLQQ